MRYFAKMEGGNTPPSWLLMSRYGVGIFLVIGTLITMLEDENGRQDVALKAFAASVAVGAGVAAGHLMDYLKSWLLPHPQSKTPDLLVRAFCVKDKPFAFGCDLIPPPALFNSNPRLNLQPPSE